MDIGDKLKKSRTDARITQEQAAQALGINRQTIKEGLKGRFLTRRRRKTARLWRLEKKVAFVKVE